MGTSTTRDAQHSPSLGLQGLGPAAQSHPQPSPRPRPSGACVLAEAPGRGKPALLVSEPLSPWVPDVENFLPQAGSFLRQFPLLPGQDLESLFLCLSARL